MAPRFDDFHRRSIEERDACWAEQARRIDWHVLPQRICDYDNPPFARWFVGGQTNLCHNAVDRHLAERADQLRSSPVVAHLIDTPREPYRSEIAFPDTRRLDQEFAPQQVFSPLPADSSQLSAVMAAARGKDFVLIGPPGTGKSQTIANLIAQCLAEDKRVLFVAEKIAALDVVYRRLREVGLGEFCLELHSNKSRKLDVLGQLPVSYTHLTLPTKRIV